MLIKLEVHHKASVHQTFQALLTDSLEGRNKHLVESAYFLSQQYLIGSVSFFISKKAMGSIFPQVEFPITIQQS